MKQLNKFSRIIATLCLCAIFIISATVPVWADDTPTVAFGLAHNNQNPNSIMCQTKYNRQVQRVQKVDNDALNKLY